MVRRAINRNPSGRICAYKSLIVLAIKKENKIQRTDEYCMPTFDECSDVDSYTEFTAPRPRMQKL